MNSLPKIESCRKVILAGRIAVMGGGAVLIPMLVSAIQFDPAVIAVAVTAVTPMSAFDPKRTSLHCSTFAPIIYLFHEISIWIH